MCICSTSALRHFHVNQSSFVIKSVTYALNGQRVPECLSLDYLSRYNVLCTFLFYGSFVKISRAGRGVDHLLTLRPQMAERRLLNFL